MITLPDNFTKGAYKTQKAGKLAGGVPLSTVQYWTKMGFVSLDEENKAPGTGKKREYSIFNIVEIGIIKKLADARMSFSLIEYVMEKLGEGVGLGKLLEQSCGYVVIKKTRGIETVSTIQNPDESDVIKHWYSYTDPSEDEQVLTLNLGMIAAEILSRIEKDSGVQGKKKKK